MRLTTLTWLLLASGCAPVPGDGNAASVQREVDAFLGIHVQDGIRAEVIVGEPRVLSLRADDNLLELIETVVAGDALSIRARAPIEPVVPPEASFGNDRLDFITAREEGTVALAHRIAADHFGVAASEGAAVQVGGTCRTLSAIASDNAHLEARSLRCEVVRVDAQGGSTVEVTALERVEVYASGGSVVIVQGAPEEVVSFLTGESVLTLLP